MTGNETVGFGVSARDECPETGGMVIGSPPGLSTLATQT